MTINKEEIIGFYIYGIEGGYDINDKPIKTLKELYEFLQYTKRFDKEQGFKDTYYVKVETKTSFYDGYVLRKYKNKYMLK